MDFRRIALSNQRRRRVLQEEQAGGDAVEAPVPSVPRRIRSASRPARTYSESALEENQPRITDLLPHRRWVQVMVLCLLITAILGLGVLHANLSEWQTEFGSEAVALINPESPGSLSRWLSSAMLGWAAVLSLVIFSLRRHKTDDYHARYRVWILVTIGLFTASMDVSTGAHHLLIDAVRIAGQRWLPGRSSTANIGTWCWVVICVAGFGFLFRLAIEVQKNRLAFASLVVATIGYAIAGVAAAGWWGPASTHAVVLVAASMRLTAELSVLFSIMVYGRHVYLDAQGLLPRSSGTTKKPKESRDAPSRTRESNSATLDAGRDESLNTAADGTSRRSDLDAEPQATSGGGSGGSGGGSARTSATPTTASQDARTGGSTSTPAAVRKPVLAVRPTGTGPSGSALPTGSHSAESDDDEIDSDGSGLTRSDRRRLKKLAKREGRNAA